MHFDQFAGDYKQILDENVALSGEDADYFAEYKARYVARALPENFVGKILDFGCGVGLLSRYVKKHLAGARVDGFDVSSESVARVEPQLRRDGTFTSNWAELACDYDVIVAANVMHHIAPPDRSGAVKDLAGRLSPSGYMVVFEHNPLNPITRRTVDRCAFDKDAVLLTMREAAGYLADAHLRVTRRDYIVFMPRFLAWLRPLEPWLAGVPLGAQYALVGKKDGQDWSDRGQDHSESRGLS